MGQKVQVIGAVYLKQSRVQRQVRCRLHQAAHRPPRQFVQHMLKPLRHLVAIDQAAPKHFLAACVKGVLGVVEDLHGGLLFGRTIFNWLVSLTSSLPSCLSLFLSHFP